MGCLYIGGIFRRRFGVPVELCLCQLQPERFSLALTHRAARHLL